MILTLEEFTDKYYKYTPDEEIDISFGSIEEHRVIFDLAIQEAYKEYLKSI